MSTKTHKLYSNKMDHKLAQTEDLTGYVTELISYVARTASQYASNMRPDRLTHPIPFFGNVRTAEALTIGLNPSADEFLPGAGRVTMTAAALTRGCWVLRIPRIAAASMVQQVD